MAPKLYMIPASPPVRAVQMVAKEIGLKLELQELNFQNGDHKKPEYLKLNPTHTVPTLVDDDFVLWESHAILPYLIEKYAKNDSLYPKDPKRRAIIDQQLHFETGVVFGRLRNIVRPVLLGEKKTIDEADKDLINEAYGFVESFLEKRSWVAGNSPTIADYSLVSSISSSNALVPINPSKYSKLTAWLKHCEGLSGYDENRKGLKIFTAFVNSMLAESQ